MDIVWIFHIRLFLEARITYKIQCIKVKNEHDLASNVIPETLFLRRYSIDVTPTSHQIQLVS